MVGEQAHVVGHLLAHGPVARDVVLVLLPSRVTIRVRCRLRTRRSSWIQSLILGQNLCRVEDREQLPVSLPRIEVAGVDRVVRGPEVEPVDVVRDRPGQPDRIWCVQPRFVESLADRDELAHAAGHPMLLMRGAPGAIPDLLVPASLPVLPLAWAVRHEPFASRTLTRFVVLPTLIRRV